MTCSSKRFSPSTPLLPALTMLKPSRPPAKSSIVAAIFPNTGDVSALSEALTQESGQLPPLQRCRSNAKFRPSPHGCRVDCVRPALRGVAKSPDRWADQSEMHFAEAIRKAICPRLKQATALTCRGWLHPSAAFQMAWRVLFSIWNALISIRRAAPIVHAEHNLQFGLAIMHRRLRSEDRRHFHPNQLCAGGRFSSLQSSTAILA
jgi:hypothetical protein